MRIGIGFIAGITTFCLALGIAMPALAQSSADVLPPPAVELQAGWTAFVDEAPIGHTMVGGAARIYLTPRLAVGPEVVYMRGPGEDRDVFVTGNLIFDVRRPHDGRPPRVSPFLVAGGGFMRHSDRFGPITFSSSEGAFTAGGGARVWLTDRVYAMGEYRLGWELHARMNGGVGILM